MRAAEVIFRQAYFIYDSNRFALECSPHTRRSTSSSDKPVEPMTQTVCGWRYARVRAAGQRKGGPPATLTSRGELEYESVAVRAAAGGGSVEIALLVENQAATGLRSAAECVDAGGLPMALRLWRQLEYFSAGLILTGPAHGSGTGEVEIACRVDRHRADARGGAKIVAHGIRPTASGLRGQLEDSAASKNAVARSRAVDVALPVQDDGRIWKGAVASIKAMQNGIVSRLGIELEDGSAAIAGDARPEIIAAISGCAVKVVARGSG